MRISHWMMIAATLTGAFISSVASAAPDYRVRLIHEVSSKDLIKVGSAWRKDLPKRIAVSLRVNADTPSSAIFVKAYFYDKDNKMVASGVAPNQIWTDTKRGFDSVLLPATLESGKDIDVFFALPEDLTAKKWKTVVVVFGTPKAVAARSFPATLLPKLDFPEKGIVIEEKSNGL